MKQVYKEHQTTKRDEAPSPDPQPEAVETPVADGVDDLLDEIDEVLEENAAEFVNAFRQKGGE